MKNKPPKMFKIIKLMKHQKNLPDFLPLHTFYPLHRWTLLRYTHPAKHIEDGGKKFFKRCNALNDKSEKW